MSTPSDSPQVGLLGPIIIRNGATVTSVNGPRQRRILALLAINPGRTVAADFLIDQVWNGRPPPTAASAMRVHLAHVRKVLAELSHGRALLEFQPPGYCLHGSVGSDVREFELLIREARTALARPDLPTALATMDMALGLWRGAALQGLDDVDALRAEAERLEAVRQDVQDEWADVRLELGQHEILSTVLSDAVRLAPLRERRTAQLMLALHRSGRQADALKACRDLRRMLVDELGVEPGDRIQKLEGAILRNEPELRWAGARDRSAARRTADAPEVRSEPSRRRRSGNLVESGVPPLIRVLVAQKWAAISPQARKMLQCLMVMDGAAPVVVLSDALGLSASEVIEMTDEVLAVGGLLDRGVAPGMVALANRHFGLVIGEDLTSTAEMIQLHVHVGRSLQRSATANSSQQVARHLLLAKSLLPLEDVARAATLGASEALRLRDAQEALELAEEGLDLIGAVESRAALSIDLLLCVMGAQSQLGRVDEAERAWSRAIDLARRAADAERFALVMLGREWTRGIIGDDGGDRRLLTEALDMLPAEPSALRVRIGSALLSESLVPGRQLDLGPLAEEVRSGATAVGDQTSLLTALSAQHVVLRRYPVDAGMREMVAECEALAQAHPDPEWRASTCLDALFLSVRTAPAAIIDRDLESLRKSVVRSGSNRLSWHLALSECCIASMRGEFDLADQYCDEAVAIGAGAGISDALPAAMIHRYLRDFHTSKVAQHVDTLESLISMYPGFTLIRAGAALALVQDGQLQRSTEMIINVLDVLENTPIDDGLVMTAALAAEAAAQLEGTADLRARLATLLGPYSGECVVFGQIAGVFGPVDRSLALLRHTEFTVETTLRGLQTAREQSTASGSPIWELRCESDARRLSGITATARNV